MNKYILILILFLICKSTFAQMEKVMINGHEFKFVQTTFNDTLQAAFIEVYKNDKKLITHTRSHFDGDCSSENIELGSYEIKDDTIIFYSYWASGDRMMKYIYPFGFRKRIYVVTDDGKLYQTSSVIYVESYIDDFRVHKGMEFLHKAPTTDAERKLLKDYVSKAEKMYFGNFAFGDDKDLLEKEVRKKLKSEIKVNTKYWKEAFGDNCNM